MQPPAAILTLDRETRLASIGCMFQYISNNFHDFLADKKGPIYAVEWSPIVRTSFVWSYGCIPGYCIVHE